ncbi:MAG: SOS response-associated peptidase family protein [Chlorobia bacterium]|nr:SOS response-associated peptidase family protein [Fimbriimonadaceae bacterium]
MCHRYFQEHQSAKVAEKYAARDMTITAEEIPEEVYPTYRSVVVLTEDGQRVLKTMYWAFIPGWVKDADLEKFSKPNNARDDTVVRNLMERRGMYYQAMQSARCILTATGWCEWSGEKGKRVANRLSVRGQEFVSFAGLYTYRAGFPGLSCVMITAAAQGKAAEFHERVPVVLTSEEDEARWLDPQSDPKNLLDLFQSISDDLLQVEIRPQDQIVPRRRKPDQEDLFEF